MREIPTPPCVGMALIYCGMRSLENYPEQLIGTALKKKRGKSDDKTTLLIKCASSGYYPSINEREKEFKDYFLKNQELGGSWQHIFVVFPNSNIQLR